MTDPFFALESGATDISEADFIAKVTSEESNIDNIIYRPDKFKNPYGGGRFRIRNKSFSDCSFSKTLIEHVEFNNCTFSNCLFISTVFYDCRMTNCKFIECNTYRIEFKESFIDPTCFVQCLSNHAYANIGVYLFQELLRNSRSQSQPDFADTAQFYFRKWRRHYIRQDLMNERAPKRIVMWIHIFLLFIFELAVGSGARLRRFMLSSIVLMLTFTLINWLNQNRFGLEFEQGGGLSFVEAVYFSIVVVTTLGFGDISPTTEIGQIVISGQALVGFTMFAIFASMLYRKFSA